MAQIMLHKFATIYWYIIYVLELVWPDWAIYYTLGNFSKHVVTVILLKLPTFLGESFVKIFQF